MKQLAQPPSVPQLIHEIDYKILGYKGKYTATWDIGTAVGAAERGQDGKIAIKESRFVQTPLARLT
jgi:hypothetical protein